MRLEPPSLNSSTVENEGMDRLMGAALDGTCPRNPWVHWLVRLFR